jgi:antitoxin ParD1/3/4
MEKTTANKHRLNTGRDQNAIGRMECCWDVVHSGLRLLEDAENKAIALKAAIKKGLDSPRIENFDFKENLKKLKAEKVKP